MQNTMARYVVVIGTMLFMFGGFIACGSSLYQVSLHDDVDEREAAAVVTDPNSTTYGIHAVDGWNELPIKYKFAPDMSSEQKTALNQAIKTWEKIVGKKLFSYTGIHADTKGDNFPDLYSSLSDGINGHYLDYDWAKTNKKPVVLATTIWNNSSDNNNQIAGADIHFNTEYYTIGDSLFTSAQDGKEVVDMESLALHELGHLLGLAHVDPKVDPLSVMNPQLFIGEGLTSRKVSKKDIERIQQIYGCNGKSCDVDAVFEEIEMRADKETTEAQSASVENTSGTTAH